MMIVLFFFFNDTATTEIYTLSLHDALPIFETPEGGLEVDSLALSEQVRAVSKDRLTRRRGKLSPETLSTLDRADRKSTRLNSSHANISYAVFCLKKKKKQANTNYAP